MRRLLLSALAPVLLVTGCSAGEDPAPEPTGIDGVERFDDLSTDHVEGSVDYAQTPPVGGEHHARWLACDVYDEPVPDEAAVHSLEHGAVWITHDPGLPAGDVEALAGLAEVDAEYVLVTPYEGLPSPVVATAWGLQLQADDAADPRLRAFTEAYAGGDQGGEPGVPCREGGVSPEDAAALVEGG